MPSLKLIKIPSENIENEVKDNWNNICKYINERKSSYELSFKFDIKIPKLKTTFEKINNEPQ